MAKHGIKTYTTETFRETYMEAELDSHLKPGFGKFFITRVEDMIRHIRLPVPPIRSTIHTLIFLTEGEANMTIGSETCHIVKGECLLVPQGQVYAFDRHDLNKGFICGFHPDMLTAKPGTMDLPKTFAFLNPWSDPTIRPDVQTGKYMLQLLRRIFASYRQNGMQQLAIISSYFNALLCEIGQVYTDSQTVQHSHYAALCSAFRELVFRNFRSMHLVSEYADVLHITPNHLNKVVRQVSGKSPGRWIDDTLVMEAKVLLYQTDWSIGAIASEIGIDDASYFSRLFKKHEACTPLQFRRMIEKS